VLAFFLLGLDKKNKKIILVCRKTAVNPYDGDSIVNIEFTFHGILILLGRIISLFHGYIPWRYSDKICFVILFFYEFEELNFVKQILS
jgi:hypothetical protein